VFVDTHAHIHEPSYSLGGDEVLQRGQAAGVEKVICVGTNELSSRQAVEFAAERDGVFASIGVHPHDTKEGWGEIAKIAQEMVSSSPFRPLPQENGFAPRPNRAPASVQSRAADVFLSGEDRAALQIQSQQKRKKLVAIGEIGLDYFYTHSPREMQIKALEEQLDIAVSHNLPVIFHVRDAFDDFWPIFDNFHDLRGVLHSFTDTEKNLEEGLKRGLFIGVNGISTFTKDQLQQQMFAQIPLERMLLETDAPFLTPVPFRGTINEPAYIRRIAEYHAEGRGLSLGEVATATTANTTALFAI
jgi:TatD DNase family protein